MGVVKRRILTVEDDAAIRRGIVDALNFAGYDTLEAANADRGMDLALHNAFDLLLLDLVLPGRGDGFDILRAVRKARPTLPVIILSARGEEADRVRGLKDGADDYVVKPFSVKELLARVEAVMRRSPERPSDVQRIQAGTISIDLQRAEVRDEQGNATPLSERETELLRYLAANPSRVVSRDELLEHVWGISPEGISTRTIDMHVARLREKIESDPAHPELLLTVRGKGYKIALPNA